MNDKIINVQSEKNYDLSIIIVCFNMQREILRSIHTLLPPYQTGLTDKKVEIIVVDNGSDSIPDLGQYNDRVKFIRYNPVNNSPVMAINHAVKKSSSDFIGVLIDGARMVTPGLCKQVIDVKSIYSRAFISTMAYHIGPDLQNNTVFNGYNQKIEDQLLDLIEWKINGYDLFIASKLALSSKNGLFGTISESNAVFMSKDIWAQLGGYDERFTSIGGGYTNLDFYKRACELEDINLIRLANEASFHQVHGGVATNTVIGKHNKIFNEEYLNIRGQEFSPSNKIPYIFGELIPHLQYLYGKNCSSEKSQYFNGLKARLNQFLKNKCNGLEYK